MSIEEHKALVRRLFDVWNTGNVEAVDALYAPDFVADYRPYAPLRRGPEAVKDMVRRARATFPDYHEELLDLIAEGDRVVAHFTITGTQAGAWGPVPATGKRLAYEEIVILRIRDGKVVHQRGIVDNLNALRQLGVVPTPPPSPE